MRLEHFDKYAKASRLTIGATRLYFSYGECVAFETPVFKLRAAARSATSEKHMRLMNCAHFRIVSYVDEAAWLRHVAAALHALGNQATMHPESLAAPPRIPMANAVDSIVDGIAARD